MKRYKKNSFIRIMKLFLLQLFLFAAIIILGKALYSAVFHEAADNSSPTEKSSYQDIPDTTKISNVSIIPSAVETAGTDPASDIAADTLTSRNAVLVNLADDKVLFDKKGEETIYPASLTKIMTAVVALENLKDLKQNITLPADMFDDLYKEDASMAGFLPGETVPAIDLLYGALLPSGAECCIGLADYISGSETAFVALMNDKAEALGMDHTHFANSTGLHASDHYTSAGDLAVLLEYCLQNDTFRDIFTAKKHSTGPTNLHRGGITFYSTLFKSMASSDFKDGSILGGKTGYTKEAGLCLASLAEKNGREYILITAGADGDHSTEQFNISDALYVYGHLD